jgi:predicted DNA-binding transcriptional regulator AlpA
MSTPETLDEDGPLLWKISEVMAQTGYSKSTVLRLADQGSLRRVRPTVAGQPARSVRFFRHEVIAYLESCYEELPEQAAPTQRPSHPSVAVRRRVPARVTARRSGHQSWRDYRAAGNSRPPKEAE